jgi:hypothetical protein
MKNKASGEWLFLPCKEPFPSGPHVIGKPSARFFVLMALGYVYATFVHGG